MTDEETVRQVLQKYNNGLVTTEEAVAALLHRIREVEASRDEALDLLDHATEQTEAALDDWAAASQTVQDVEFLWDWRINQGFAFLVHPEDAETMRLLLAGSKLEDIEGFDWVAEAREQYREDTEEPS